ncbi:MAG: MMPL family transporter, partial [Rhodospirillales bacterium]
ITAGLATLVVGQFNLISVAFAVLFIGLGVDFTLHYTLRAQEELASGGSRKEALGRATGQAGAALLLCAVSSAVAFFSFTPTDYSGVAELGLIAGMGMFVALTLSLTLLPALLILLGTGGRFRSDRGGLVTPLASFAVRRSGLVLVLATVITGASVIVIPQLRFDHDPMNLRDPSAQSVELARELMADPDRQTYAIDILVRDEATLKDLKAKLEALETVAEVRTAGSLYPGDQEEKHAIIQDLSFFLGPMAVQPVVTTPLTDEARQQAARQLVTLVNSASEDFGAAGKRLATAVSALSGDPDLLRRAEFLLLSGLDGRLQAIFAALRASTFVAGDIPQHLTRFWISDNGQLRLEVIPHGDMSDDDLRADFVDQVTAVVPDATGTPVIIRAAGEAVVGAFMQAILYASLAVLILLMFMLRNLLDVVIVAIPALVGAIVTGGLMWVIGLSLNFANIIVLPLLFGLSVDFGIHMVMRAREGRLEDIYEVSTMRAIVYSALTTVGSFAALSLSPHVGTASMGLLLTLSLGVTIVATLLITPALLQATAGWRRGSDV